MYNPSRGELPSDEKFRVKLRLDEGNVVIKNLRRGVSVTGAAGSGKTESVIFNLLQHFNEYNFCGLSTTIKILS